VTLKKKNESRMYEERILRKRSGPKRKKETWQRRKSHNEEVHHLHS
jgi:hypothetical protein